MFRWFLPSGVHIFSLYSSTSLSVSFPSFAVIPDKEIETIRTVDFVTYQGEGVDDKIEEIQKPIKANAWDGQGVNIAGAC